MINPSSRQKLKIDGAGPCIALNMFVKTEAAAGKPKVQSSTKSGKGDTKVEEEQKNVADSVKTEGGK